MSKFTNLRNVVEFAAACTAVYLAPPVGFLYSVVIFVGANQIAEIITSFIAGE